MKNPTKKLLILGAYNTEIEIVHAARRMGIYSIVTDYHTDYNQAPAKYHADEAWDISWSDLDALSKLCKEHQVDGCLAGFSERRVKCAQQLCDTMGFPFYTDGADTYSVFDKQRFKDICLKSGLAVPKSFNYGDDCEFPVIVKPTDNAGSRGISICYTKDELDTAYEHALRQSDNRRALIEEYIEADEVMIFFTVHNGICTLSAMCDRKMKRFSRNIAQLPIGYQYPSKYLASFRENSEHLFQKLIHNLGIRNGLIAFQSFAKDDKFIPFDPTYRLDGTMTYHITEFMNNVNVLERIINYSISGSMGCDQKIIDLEKPEFPRIAYQIPILLGEGKISRIIGLDKVLEIPEVIHISKRLDLGHECSKLADFSQILCRIHLYSNNEYDLNWSIKRIMNSVDVLDEKGRSMVIGNGNEQTILTRKIRYSIMGAGCVGSVIAERLLSIDSDLSLIATGKRGDILRNKGIRINGERLLIPVVEPGTGPTPDVLFICVKNYDLENSLEELNRFIDSHTVIIPMLNGISSTPTIQTAYPHNRVLYGYIQKIDALFVGDEYRYSVAGDIHFGDAINEEIFGILVAIQEDLVKAGFDAYIDENMIRGVWKKWMLNIGANQISALTNATYLQFSKIPEIEKVLRLAMNEVLDISKLEGIELDENDVTSAVEYLITYTQPKKTSMLQDIINKRRTEIDYISGDLIELSKKWNIPCPVNLTLYYLIKSKEKMYL